VPAAFATVLRAADNSRGENDKRREGIKRTLASGLSATERLWDIARHSK
jgi:hypothetical protein